MAFWQMVCILDAVVLAILCSSPASSPRSLAKLAHKKLEAWVIGGGDMRTQYEWDMSSEYVDERMDLDRFAVFFSDIKPSSWMTTTTW
jgi:hypothetical protein